MDGRQFDDLLRSLAGTRRAALGSLLAAVGGLAILPAADARKRKKKKGCRGCRICTSCVKGKCVPVPDRTPCGGTCQECMGGQCANKAAGTSCGSDNQCLGGVCNSRPTCVNGGVSGCTEQTAANCCSGVCEPLTTTVNVCAKAAAGQQCKSNDGCASGACVGYRCE
ncbi:MAG: hypothetical protein U0075_09555 [Thermomicrobiales bacterium]